MVTRKSKTPPTSIDPDPLQLPPHTLAKLSLSHKHSRHDLEAVKISEIAWVLFSPAGESEERKFSRIQHALELYEALDPGDAAEAMLVRQMIGAHFAAQECFRRANLSNQTSEGRELALRHAAKLSALYTKQLAAYDKRRGKGQQKVTVEHVHVHSGGQAIVGNVGADRAAAPSPDVKQLENAPGILMPSLDETPTRQRAPDRSGGKK
jgi:hypothetical protein